MIRHLAGDIDPADDGDTVLDHGLAGACQFAVASALARSCLVVKLRRSHRWRISGEAGGTRNLFVDVFDRELVQHIFDDLSHHAQWLVTGTVPMRCRRS